MLRAVPLLDLAAFVVGVLLVARVLLSAVRTFVLPRASNDRIAQVVFHLTRRGFDLVAGPGKPYATRDRYMAYFGPVSLIVLPGVWLLIVHGRLHAALLGDRRGAAVRRVRRQRVVAADARLRPARRPPARTSSRSARRSSAWGWWRC